MMSLPARLGLSLLRFSGWSLFFALVYSMTADYYAEMVVAIADWFTSFFVPISLETNPRGLVATSPDASYPMGIPYSLRLIGLNAIFAPALALATIGASLRGILRACFALFIMALFHGVEVSSIVLFHVSHPDNTAISLGYPDAIVSSIQWTYRFLDRMSYALFPFLAWAIACPEVVSSLFLPRNKLEDKGISKNTSSHT